MDTFDNEQPTTLTEAQIRSIVRDEIKKSSNLKTQADRTIVEKNLQILDARNIQVGAQTGTMIGTSATQKVGFFGTTPVVKAGAVTAPSGGGTSSSNAIDVSARAAITSLIAAIKNIGISN